MRFAKVFKCGNSQAIRLPKDFRFKGKEVEISKQKNIVIIREIKKNLGEAFNILCSFPDDFFSEKREDMPPQKREEL